MRFVVALLLALHGIVHLIGFRAAFWASPGSAAKTSLLSGGVEVGQLGARGLGIVWLLLMVAYLAAACLLLLRSPAFEAVAWWATGASFLMCGLFWPDARFGLGIDALLLLALLVFSRSSSAHLELAFREELGAAQLLKPLSASPLIDEAAIASLPEPAQRYLRFMGVIGRPRDWSVSARFRARFRRDAGPWLECEAWQYDNRLEVSRIFYMQLALKRLLPVTVRDTYLAGSGRMRAAALDLVDVVDVTGPELDAGELVTYLNDAILLAPSLLLGPETSWRGVDDHAFEVTLSDGGLRVSARVSIDPRGALVDFRTTDRFFQMPDGKLVRTEWRTPVDGWQKHAGRMLPTRAQAVWQLPSGPFPYADFAFDPQLLAFNVAPGT